MARCNLYARFSPRPNAAKCESCESQLEEMREWAARHQHTIAGEYADRALSGADSWEKRPGLLDALKATKREMILVVRSLDRLFKDTRAALEFKSLLTMKGATLVSITEESACDNSPMGDAIQTFLLAIAEMQRKISNARTKAKMRKHQANGRKMGGHPPYGKRCYLKQLIPDEYEERVMKRVLTLRAEGNGQRKICRILTDEGWHPRGRRWRPETIARILRRFPEIEELRVKTEQQTPPPTDRDANQS